MAEYKSLDGNALDKLHEVQLHILKDVAQFCDENHITYCLSSGTLLGAVRHHGFIPWDDDVDIMMPRKDFEKFMEISDKLPEAYVCLSPRLNPEYPLSAMKVKKRGTVMIEPSQAHLNIDQGVWIDIFPLDRVSNIDKFPKRAYHYTVLDMVLLHKTRVCIQQKLRTRFFCKLLGVLGVRRLDKWRTRIMMKEEKTNGTKLVSLTDPIGWKKLLFDETVYFPLQKIKFEDMLFYVPAKYDEWLTSAYGDYMTPPPIEKRTSKHHITEIIL